MTWRKKTKFKNVRGDKERGFQGSKCVNGKNVTVQARTALHCAQKLNQKCIDQGWPELNPGIGRAKSDWSHSRKESDHSETQNSEVEESESSEMEESEGSEMEESESSGME